MSPGATPVSPVASTQLVTCMDATDHGRAADIDRCYADLDVGLADLSLIVAAKRHGTRRLLTFDERDLRAVTTPCGS